MNYRLPISAVMFVSLLIVIGASLFLWQSKRAMAPGVDPITQSTATATPSSSPTPVPTYTILAAGDIADCKSTGDEATAALLATNDGTILTLGDTVYSNGTEQEFKDCYHPSWGQFKSRTKPVPGNHDYHTKNAAPYYAYFGEAAGDPGKGYYSFDLGNWHLIALNSNCSNIGGCGPESVQVQWLKADLAANAKTCTLAYWHHPRFSSGSTHGSNKNMQTFWDILYDAGAEVVLNGHEHFYERFVPQNKEGVLDNEKGVREFIVGTGGKSFYGFKTTPLSTSEARNGSATGVLKMTLAEASYSWEFLDTAHTFTDTGSGICH